MGRVGVWVVVAALVLTGGLASPAAADVGVWPIAGGVTRAYDLPEARWGSGHRGVDLAGEPEAAVRTPRPGVVSFVGVVAGEAVVVVSHGETRTTFQPVVASVPVGQRVAAGEVVGRLLAGHAPCPASACLHWGLKKGEEYLDPLVLVAGDYRLLPDAAVADVARRAAEREAAAAAAGQGGGAPLGGSGVLAAPTQGRLGSRFGPRFHPIFHAWRQHSGIDLSASCGTPLHAAAAGVVSHVGFDASGGWRLVIDHGQVAGTRLHTVYLHAQGYRVRVGQTVERGAFVGTMGSTGWSTGCHLHFSVKADGRLVDPLRWLA